MSVFTSADQIGAYLHEALQTVRAGENQAGTTRPWETDIGVCVFEGRRRIDPDMVPCTAIIEADDVVTRAAVSTQYNVGQKFALVAYVRCESDHPNRAAHAALRDMKRLVFRPVGGKPTRFLGDRNNEVTYLGHQIAPREDGQNFVVAILEIEVAYVEDLGK